MANEVNRIAELLLDAWKKADPKSSVALHPTSYVATFADMATAIIEDRNTRPAAPVEGLETVALLNEAKELAFTAISRMRAAHISCLDLTMQAEKLVGNIDTATRTRSQAEAIIAAKVEQERLRFEGDLDKWMKIIGAGITGYQPEAYALMDSACQELVKLRADNAAKDQTISDLRSEVESLSAIVKSEIDDVAGATIDDLEADNAALTARVKELELIRDSHSQDTLQALLEKQALETQLAAAKKALGPFADHAKERVVDEPEWRDNYTVQIVVTIGELRQARAAALEAKP